MAPRVRTGAIDQAEAHIIRTPDATYRTTAEAFGLSTNTLRARIDNKYGCLRMARQAGYAEPGRILRAVRRCITCKKSANIDRGLYRCKSCIKKAEDIHDGPV